MARLNAEVPERAEIFCDRVPDVVDALPRRRVSARVIDQMVGAGTSVGANMFEADEAAGRPDFCKSLGAVVKELNETRFWLRLVGRRGWIKPVRLAGLESECNELRLIFGAMIARTREKPRTTNRR